MSKDSIRERTTRQMQSAPIGSTFVWCNKYVAYPTALAQKLGRCDLVIRPLSWLKIKNVLGRRIIIVVDHAARLDNTGYDALDYVDQQRVYGAKRVGGD